MRINFDDGGYIEFIRSSNNNIIIVIQAIDSTDILKKITNACELTPQQFQELCKDLQ